MPRSSIPTLLQKLIVGLVIGGGGWESNPPAGFTGSLVVLTQHDFTGELVLFRGHLLFIGKVIDLCH
jgi:hypothetical protein